jgi:hypothetical protein
MAIFATEDIWNAALRDIGYPRPIGEAYEGSRASRVAIEVYAPLRDALLFSQDWDFAQRETELTPTVGGTLILGFSNEYNFPADGVRVKSVYAPVTMPDFDPQPLRWLAANDRSLLPPARVIYATVASASASYIGRITDPGTWNAGFMEAMIAALAKVFQFALGSDPNVAKLRSDLSDQEMLRAASVGDLLPATLPEMMIRGAAAARA